MRGRETRMQDQDPLLLSPSPTETHTHTHTHTHTPIHGFFHTWPCHSAAHHVVKLHDDVRAWRGRQEHSHWESPHLQLGTSWTPLVPLCVLLAPTKPLHLFIQQPEGAFQNAHLGVLSWLSGLRIQHVIAMAQVTACGTGSIPGPGISACHGCGQKNPKKMHI